ncbi:hypothetical protein GRI97_12085 [Altererythrobacter xixiisoli]|uniref:Transferrin-binding protein B C-lobe/N-lobe beta barrel domain-containing protein n=1 Tax=Croceibacterium xixiisoli TaxID=1476466 RepID=A0A6I4TWW8_9SPHN|nr:hypothetical protein [Croceibacterium xixiisoli]MXO99730.1 hypothetical protein [Croceibacterium xixiisoli]
MFEMACASYDTIWWGFIGRQVPALAGFGDTATLSRQANGTLALADDNWAFKPDGTREHLFGASDLAASSTSPLKLEYQRTVEFEGLKTFRISTFSQGETKAEFVNNLYFADGQGTSRTYDLMHHCMFGAPTLTDDLPTTGSATFTPAFADAGGDGATGFAIDPARSSINVDYSASTVSFTLQFIKLGRTAAENTDVALHSGSGTIDKAKRQVSGTLTNATSPDISWKLSGWFFGPGGKELAFAVAASDFGSHIQGGTVIALRQ